MAAALPLMESVLMPLVKSVLLPLGLSAGTSAAAIQKKTYLIGHNDINNFKGRNGRYNKNS